MLGDRSSVGGQVVDIKLSSSREGAGGDGLKQNSVEGTLIMLAEIIFHVNLHLIIFHASLHFTNLSSIFNTVPLNSFFFLLQT